MRRADLENFQGEFRGWTPDKRTEFIIKAQSIIKKYTYMGFGHIVVKEGFDKALPANLRKTFGGAYGFCGYLCLQIVGQWCDAHNYQGKVRYVFEAGTAGHGQLDHMLRDTYNRQADGGKYRIGGWSFEDKETIPLQAADVIAYESFKIGENHIAQNSGKKLRASAKALMRKQDRSHIAYWTEKSLRDWFESFVREYSKGNLHE